MILTSLSESLAAETAALVDLASLATLWRLFAVLLVAALLVSGTELVTARAKSRGLDVHRTLGTVRLAVRAGVLVWLTVVSARTLLSVAPIITACAAGLTVAVAAVSVLRRIPGIFVGIMLALRGRLREGDRIEAGGLRGRLERIGPFECLLRQDDGAVVVLPTYRLTAGGSLVIARQDSPVPLSVVLTGTSDPETQRRRALLCPYRAPHTDVTVTRSDAGQATVTLFVWPGSERVATLALTARSAGKD